MKRGQFRHHAGLVFIGAVERVEGERARIKLHSEFCEGLDKLQLYSHVIVLGWFHLRDNVKDRQTLRVTPKRQPRAPEVGVFASRSPSRPNPVGLCVAQILDIEGCTLIVRGLDFSNGTPIIDIKPYIPRIDSIQDAKVPEWSVRGAIV